MNVKNKFSCPICDKGQLIYSFNARALDYSTEGNFDIFVCTVCGHGVTVLNGMDLSGLYEKGNYDAKEGLLRKSLRPLLDMQEFNKVRGLRRWVPSGSVFEVGTGKGRFLRVARLMGFEVSGIEPSRRSRSFTKGILAEAITGETLEEYAKHVERRFDALCAWHVLEHMVSPEMAINKMHSIIKDGGVLMIAVPNFASRQALTGKANWYHLDPPRHLHHFTEISLRTLLEKNNFEVLEISYSSFFQNWLGEAITLLNRLSPSKNTILNLLKSNHLFFEKEGAGKALFLVMWNLILSPLIVPPTVLMNLISSG